MTEGFDRWAVKPMNRQVEVTLSEHASDGALHAARQVLANEPPLLPGHVWLVGAGPSDPAQLTLQAVAAIAQAEVLVHDALVDTRVLQLAPATAERVFVGKRGGQPSIAQSAICERLVQLARDGRKVVRLKGGDPYVFARGGEEVLALAQAGIPFRVIAGLTSGLAALNAASIPATIRGINHSLVLLTGHEEDAHAPGAPNWPLLAQLAEPLVIYMALRNLRRISAALTAGGLDVAVPVAVIAGVGTDTEQVIVASLADIARKVEEARVTAPAIVVVGKIVSHREELRRAGSGSVNRCP